MNILITGAWNDAKKHIEKIENLGHSVCFMQHEDEGIACEYDWADMIICNGLFLHHDISRFSNLKYIQLTSAGFDRINMEQINAKGIQIKNAAGVYSIPMAEFAVGSIIQFYKSSKVFYEKQKKHKWVKDRSLMELYGKTAVILGCGSIGTECAKRLDAFDCNVLGISKSGRQKSYFKEVFTTDELDILLSQADILIIAAPLNSDTRNIINRERLTALKDRCVVVNIARGPIIDEKALVDVLKQNRIYAALDVFDNEPLDESNELWDMENVILTPHNSFVGDGNSDRLYEIIFNNLKMWSI